MRKITEPIKINEKFLELKSKPLYYRYLDTKYYVNSLGEVIRLYPTPVFLTPSKISTGYRKVYLHIGKEIHQEYVHRLVYQIFKGEIKGEINHIDNNKDNNFVSNLEDVSHAGNMKAYGELYRACMVVKTCKSMYLLNLSNNTRTYFVNRVEASKFIGKHKNYINQKFADQIYFNKEYIFIDSNIYNSQNFSEKSQKEIMNYYLKNVNFIQLFDYKQKQTKLNIMKDNVTIGQTHSSKEIYQAMIVDIIDKFNQTKMDMLFEYVLELNRKTINDPAQNNYTRRKCFNETGVIYKNFWKDLEYLE